MAGESPRRRLGAAPPKPLRRTELATASHNPSSLPDKRMRLTSSCQPTACSVRCSGDAVHSGAQASVSPKNSRMNGGGRQCPIPPPWRPWFAISFYAEMLAAVSIRLMHVAFVRGGIKPSRQYPQNSLSAQAEPEADPPPRHYLRLTEQ